MSDIPQARQILQSAITMGDIRDMRVGIETALKYMTREPFTRKSPVRSERITKEMVNSVFRCAQQHPSMPMQQIAEQFGVNVGRVSEILQGAHNDKL